MRIALTVLLIAAGLMAEARLPEAQANTAAAPVPYEATATILPAVVHLLTGGEDCDVTRVWDI
jgi:hypothetical protein